MLGRASLLDGAAAAHANANTRIIQHRAAKHAMWGRAVQIYDNYRRLIRASNDGERQLGVATSPGVKRHGHFNRLAEITWQCMTLS